MEKRIKFVLKLCGGMFVLSLFVMPFVISYAQENMAGNKKEARATQNSAPQDETRKAVLEVRKSVAGSLTLDKMLARESSWELKSALAAAKIRSDDPSVINMTFYKGSEMAVIHIKEYESASFAASSFHVPRSVGAGVAFSTFGNEGEKIFVERVGFSHLRFRTGNFIVSVFNRDEKTAERFAGYAAEAVENLAQKN
ncbi:MAG TPA: hypothetical protein VF599_24100 [Pyrinomonadaceae bacterium]|jgi:hypothetical protein